jgi:hypothetical protein
VEREQADVLVATKDGLQNGRLPYDNRGSHQVPVNRHAFHIRPLFYNKRLIELTNPQHQLRNITLYLIIFLKLSAPTLPSLVGVTLSGNGCGSPNHIYVISVLLVALLSQFILDN